MASRGRPFQTGNKLGRGRPRGSRNKATAQLQELLHEFATPMLRKAIADALKGDRPVLRLLLDRILPARREAPVTVGALPARTAAEVSKASEKLVQKVASGKLTIPEGEGFLSLLETRRRSIVTEELEKRILSLESKS
jgi:hypothetical protein